MGVIFSQGSGVNDSIFGKSQDPIKMFVEGKVEAFEKKSIIKNVFLMDKSKHSSEKFTSLTAMSGFSPVGEGGAYPTDEMQEGYSQVLQHDTWKNSFSVTQEMVEDANLLNLKGRPTGFVKSYGRTRELFGAGLFGSAMQKKPLTFNGKTYSTKTADGAYLFDTAHASIIDGKVQSNRFIDAFTNDNLAKAECKMQDFRDDNGNILSLVPNTIIVPNEASIKRDVFAAVGADKDPDTANNGFNFTYGRWSVIIWPYLNQFIPAGGVIPWMLADLDYNEEVGCALWLDRIELAVRSAIDENTDNNIWKGRSRFVAGFNDFRAFLAAGLPDGSTL